MRGDVGRAEHPELGERRRLVFQYDFFAVAQIARGSGKRRHFGRVREETDEVRNDARLTDAGPEGLHATRVALMARIGDGAQIAGRILRVVRVIRRGHRSLVGQNKNIAEATELLRYRRDVVIADEDVLVLFFHQLVARGHDHFNDVLACREHRRAGGECVECIRIGDTARGAVATRRFARLGIRRSHAGEMVVAIVGRRLHLVELRKTVVALVARAVGLRCRGIEC